MQNASAIAYRRDIDGLRGVAVLAVLLCHAGLPGFGGGFIGVDVFFVISGYLITSIIKAELDTNSFSFTRFYERRIRRLLPALAVVVAFTTLVSLLIMAPTDYVAFTPSVAAVAGFVSNIYFWRQTGYFAPRADEQPLLHTWSLSVEEQFYLLFPVLTYVTHRHLSTRIALRTLIAVTALISFAASCYGVFGPKSATFYLLPTRWWELTAGALLALHPDKRRPPESWRRLLRAVGFLLILGSVFAFDPTWPFPGPLAAIPVAGACLLIAPQLQPSSTTWTILGHPALALPGVISYSLYLWHFPLFAFARRLSSANGHDGNIPIRDACFLIAATFALAWLSWRTIEQPLRRSRSRVAAGPALFATAAAGLGFFCVLGLTLGSASGVALLYGDRGQQFIALASELRQLRDGPCMSLEASRLFTDGCRFGRRDGRIDLVFWGDSHAEMLRPVLDRQAVATKRVGMIAGVFGCPPVVGISATNSPACRAANEQILRTILTDNGVRDVVLAAFWTAYFDGKKLHHTGASWQLSTPAMPLPFQASEAEIALRNARILTAALQKTVRELEQHGKRVWVLGPLPENPFDPWPRHYAKIL